MPVLSLDVGSMHALPSFNVQSFTGGMLLELNVPSLLKGIDTDFSGPLQPRFQTFAFDVETKQAKKQGLGKRMMDAVKEEDGNVFDGDLEQDVHEEAHQGGD